MHLLPVVEGNRTFIEWKVQLDAAPQDARLLRRDQVERVAEKSHVVIRDRRDDAHRRRPYSIMPHRSFVPHSGQMLKPGRFISAPAMVIGDASGACSPKFTSRKVTLSRNSKPKMKRQELP